MSKSCKRNVRALAVAAALVVVSAQAAPPATTGRAVFRVGTPASGAGGGDHAPRETSDAVNPAQRKEIWNHIRSNTLKLEREGRMPQRSLVSVQFGWPLLANGLADPGVHGISNFVDQNRSSGSLVEYNCGARTYDNHAGTDFYLWPFAWYKMDNNQVSVVAAAPGTIVYRSDGNYDRSCATNNNNWNAVYVSHSDGSIAWYGHLKNGSLTGKAVGATVAQGEYLGSVGSSGNSTGPHLHFEVYDYNGYLQDPYQGSCNAMNANSLWQSQRPYYDSAINKLTTGSAAAVFPSCPNDETSNEKTAFRYGETVYFTAFYRDQLNSQQSQYRVIRPNGTVHLSWTHNGSAAYYSSSWWYWYWTNFAPSGPAGTWRFEVTYNGQTYSKNFTMSP